MTESDIRQTSMLMDAKRDDRSAPAIKLATPAASWRIDATMRTAALVGLTDGKKERRLSVRANERLVAAAQKTSGLEGSDLLEYALAKVALEDDFAEKLLALRGTVSRDVDLEF